MDRERLTGTEWEHRDGQNSCSLTCVQSGRDDTFAADPLKKVLKYSFTVGKGAVYYIKV